MQTTPLLDKREFVRQIIAPTTWGKRLANAFIDFIISYIAAVATMAGLSIVWYALGNQEIFAQMENLNGFVDRIITFLVRIVVYYIPLEFFTGKTIGKMLTRTKVVDENGDKPGLQSIIIRNFARIIPFDFVSFFKENPIGWHDQAGGTMVVDDIPLYNLEGDVSNGFYEEEERY